MTYKQKRMTEAVKFLKHYIDTYDQQTGYEDYNDETYINDILYGLGASLDNKYKFAGGYTEFKKFLVNELPNFMPKERE